MKAKDRRQVNREVNEKQLIIDQQLEEKREKRESEKREEIKRRRIRTEREYDFPN